MANKKLWLGFLGLMALYFVTRYFRSFGATPNFFKFHFTDLLFIPTVSTFSLIFVRMLKRDEKIKIPVWQIVFLVLLMSAYFEWYLPTFKSHIHPYTSDAMDIVMYSLGGMLFLLIQRKFY